MDLKIGYKASAEQFGPRRLVELGVRRRAARLRHRHRLRPLPAVAPRGRPRAVLARLDERGRRAHRARAARHQRAHAHLPLPPGGDRPGVRDDGLPVPRPRDARHRHRRGDERGRGHRHRVARVQGALRPHARVGAADPRAVERRARDVRGRLLQDRPGHGLRPPGHAGADLRRRRRPAGRALRRPRGRRLHLHERQGHGALHREAPARGRRGAREGRRARTRSTA